MSEVSAHRAPSFIVNDLVIQEDNCNLSCKYCLTGQSSFKDEHSLLKIFNPPRPMSCDRDTELGARVRAVAFAAAARGVPVLKVSGGEIFLIRGIMDFIRESAERYETVVVLTNGTLLTDTRLDALRSLGNVVVQLSLDSTRYAGNSYRVPSETVQRSLMERVSAVLESGLAVEIYTVLHNRSIESLGDTLEDLLPYAGRTALFPFPVRGRDRRRLAAQPEQHRRLREILDHPERYSGLLPGAPYLDRLWRFMSEGGRSFRCHLPRVAVTSFDDGTVTSCPNIWFNRVGNVLAEGANNVFDRVERAPFRRLLLAPTPRIDACTACFTPWDPVSLYFDGELTLDEVARIPVYRGERTRALLAEIQGAYRRGPAPCLR